MYAVETKGLTKEYKTTLAVNKVDISVPIGCCCGFLGKNGAGKTTTIKMLTGLKKPTSGSISIMGEPQAEGKRRYFGYLPDVPNYYEYMTGAEFLDYCAKLCDIPKEKRKTWVAELLRRVGLAKVRTRIAGYSRGMRQRLGIAQAMINSPKVIFMDEPVSALDPMGRRDVVEIIKSLSDTTVIFSTHILADVESVCDYILIMDKGKLLVQDYLTDIKKAHANDSAIIRFFEPESGKQFMKQAESMGNITSHATSPVEFMLNNLSGTVKELSRQVNTILHQENLAFEQFGLNKPTLEDIFYKVVEQNV